MNGNNRKQQNAAVYRDIEEQKMNELQESISSLRSLSLDIKNHLESEDKEVISKMGSNYEKGQQALKNVLSKIDDVLNSGSASRTTCYLIAIIVFFFFIMYILK